MRCAELHKLVPSLGYRPIACTSGGTPFAQQLLLLLSSTCTQEGEAGPGGEQGSDDDTEDGDDAGAPGNKVLLLALWAP